MCRCGRRGCFSGRMGFNDWPCAYMKSASLALVDLLVAFICFVGCATDNPPKNGEVFAGIFISGCDLQYGGYGQCTSELRASQVTSAPEWDISVGPLPLLPEKAEAIADREIERFVAPYAFRTEPLLFYRGTTRLVKSDKNHWFYSVTFTQHAASGNTGGWPSIEVFVTFDGKVGSLALTVPSPVDRFLK
jgi:hypothetical protein